MHNNFSFVFVQMQGAKSEKTIGGGLVFQEFLAKNLLEKGIKVYAITNSLDKYGFTFLGNDRFVANFKVNSNSILSIFSFDRKKMKSELFRIIDNLPKNCVFISVDPFPRDIISAYYIKHYLKKKTLVTMHHITPSILFHPFRRGFFRSFVAWLISIFALFVIKTQELPVFLDNKRIAKSTGWNLHNLLMEMPLTVHNVMKIPENKRGHIACFIGRLNPNKGISDLIHSWKTVNQNVSDAILYMIGNDLGNGKYQKLIKNLNLENVIKITGYLQEEEKNQIISKASLFIFPSFEEGWSLAVMEAINSGLLPILYDIPAYDYVCNEEIKLPPGNIQKLSNKIVYFFENPEKAKMIVKELQICNKKYSKEYVFDLWLGQILEQFNLI